ncbi:MAG: beta-hydroxyacyl-ACP dehydratase [Phycisphaerae bacterium]|jgi:3-hydroxyacyl-[acyl-carrier-protein] dehydratase|nr:beta-hydroxyacyl-ACP dehydratase [Phycisphaerae bacterium]
MPPMPVIDLSLIDTHKVLIDKEGIRKVNLQRYEMEQLDGILYLDHKEHILVGYKDVREDEFWVRGHIPGRPLMPGVLMIEAAAQLASYGNHEFLQSDQFVGFGAVDEVKFRGTIVPPAKLILLGKALDIRPRRIVCYVQGFVDGKMVFEAKITGMPV